MPRLKPTRFIHEIRARIRNAIRQKEIALAYRLIKSTARHMYLTNANNIEGMVKSKTCGPKTWKGTPWLD